MNKKISTKGFLFSIGISCLISACASNSKAPVADSSIHTSESTHTHTDEKKPSIETTSNDRIPTNFNGYICEDAPQYIGQSIGDGECVDLVKLCSHAPLTRFWKPGQKVFGNNIPAGTAIATFRRGKYPNKKGYHAAIYSHQDENGIYAWDQWHGQPVHLRFIKAKQSHKKAGNNASKYRVIRY